jgi:hypothetical protein
MPETNESEVRTASQIQRKNSERTEAKFYEDVDKLIAEAESAGAEYHPPNPSADVANLKAKRDASMASRTAKQTNDAAEETTRNQRENLFKPLEKDLTRLVAYAKSAGKAPNEIAALDAIARKIKGARAEAIEPSDGTRHISVSNRAYVSRTDNYADFIEQYDALELPATDDFYKTSTHRSKLAAYQDANSAVITSEARSNASRAEYDQITYLNEDSLLNACVSSKNYFKSRFKATRYQNIAKTRFELPSRLRRKK